MLLGTTLGLHIILAVTGLALPLYVLLAEYRGIRHADAEAMALARRAARVFTVVFAVGAVTGTLVAAELAILWAPFMAFASQVIILPFFIEGFAFVLEGAMIGIYLYGWDRLSPGLHFATGVAIAVASAASGLLITIVNAWMNAPGGFALSAGRVVDVRPWAAMFNAGIWPQLGHVLTMSYFMVGMLLLALAARDLLRRPDSTAARKAARIAAAPAAVSLVLTILTGDLSGKWLAVHQPEKLAAIEGLFRTQAYAPEAVGGLVSVAAERIYGAIDIPGLLSWLAYGSASHPVKGLLSFPPSTWPPTALVHVFFDTMVGLGSLSLLLLAVWLWLERRSQALPPWLLRAAVVAGPAAVVTMECGWLVDEFGRQPWVVYNIMRVDAGITHAPGAVAIGWTILALLVVLFAAAPYAAWRAVRTTATGPGFDDDVAPQADGP
jgi:cytochrome bd ubiquinol oxidase subunit I